MRLSRVVAFGALLLTGCARQPATASAPSAVVTAAPPEAGRGERGSFVAVPVAEPTGDAGQRAHGPVTNGPLAGALGESSAVNVPGADLPVHAGAAGDASGIALLRGGPLKADRWEVTLKRVRGDWTEIAERVAFPAGHGAATLAVPDRLEFGIDRDALYSPTQWGVRGLEVSVDGKRVAVRRSEQPVAEFEGAFTFELAPGARVVEVRYLVASVAPSDHSRAWSWDGRTLRTFGAPPGSFHLRWADIGDLPATQLAITFRESPHPWRFEKGGLVICLQGSYPEEIGIEVPDGPCGFQLCGPQSSDEVTCLDPTQSFACAGVLSREDGLERWMKTASAGCYDARSLTLARNWPFARRGHPFQNALLRDYFSAQPWYTNAAKAPPQIPLEAAETKAVELVKKLDGARAANRACAISRCAQAELNP